MNIKRVELLDRDITEIDADDEMKTLGFDANLIRGVSLDLADRGLKLRLVVTTSYMSCENGIYNQRMFLTPKSCFVLYEFCGLPILKVPIGPGKMVWFITNRYSFRLDDVDKRTCRTCPHALVNARDWGPNLQNRLGIAHLHGCGLPGHIVPGACPYILEHTLSEG